MTRENGPGSRRGWSAPKGSAANEGLEVMTGRKDIREREGRKALREREGCKDLQDRKALRARKDLQDRKALRARKGLQDLRGKMP